MVPLVEASQVVFVSFFRREREQDRLVHFARKLLHFFDQLRADALAALSREDLQIVQHDHAWQLLKHAIASADPDFSSVLFVVVVHVGFVRRLQLSRPVRNHVFISAHAFIIAAC